MSRDTGGPAFPTQEVFDERRGEVIQYASEGATLRDYFAAKAMEGLMARVGKHDAYLIAHNAYIVADAMLAARSKEPE
jgi:hypothetical protein